LTTIERGIVDTNVLILIDQIEPGDLPLEIFVSSISMAELAAGPHYTHDPRERARRVERLQNCEALFEPVPFDAGAARRYGHVVGSVLAAGRQPRPRRVDLMIAAVASLHRLPLFTVNPDDFAGLDGLVAIQAVTHPERR
jgi:predicted nucleic acid-binding protein